MCIDPGTLFLVTSLASAGLQTAGSLAQGQQAQQMAEMQARSIEQQAQADAQASAFEASRERHKQALLRANAIAQTGASGVALQGSPTEVLAANAREGELDLAAIRYGSTLRQNNFRTQAAISQYSGTQAKQAGLINATTGFVSGISQLYDPNRAVKFGSNPFARVAL